MNRQYNLTVEAFSLWLRIIAIPLPSSKNFQYGKLRRIEDKAWHRVNRRMEVYKREYRNELSPS